MPCPRGNHSSWNSRPPSSWAQSLDPVSSPPLLLPVFLPILSVLQKLNQVPFAILITESSSKEKQGRAGPDVLMCLAVWGAGQTLPPEGQGTQELGPYHVPPSSQAQCALGRAPPLSRQITKMLLIHLISVTQDFLGPEHFLIVSNT